MRISNTYEVVPLTSGNDKRLHTLVLDSSYGIAMKITTWCQGVESDEVIEISLSAVSRTTEGLLVSDRKSIMRIELSSEEVKLLRKVLEEDE